MGHVMITASCSLFRPPGGGQLLFYKADLPSSTWNGKDQNTLGPKPKSPSDRVFHLFRGLAPQGFPPSISRGTSGHTLPGFLHFSV